MLFVGSFKEGSRIMIQGSIIKYSSFYALVSRRFPKIWATACATLFSLLKHNLSACAKVAFPGFYTSAGIWGPFSVGITHKKKAGERFKILAYMYVHWMSQCLTTGKRLRFLIRGRDLFAHIKKKHTSVVMAEPPVLQVDAGRTMMLLKLWWVGTEQRFWGQGTSAMFSQ